MAWAKVDDGWWCHPKVIGLSAAARGVWVSALSWSCHQRKDVVPESLLGLVGGSKAEANELLDAGLWVASEGGFRIHDWAEYQVKTTSEKRAEAGRLGGVASGRSRRPDQGERSKPEATTKQTPFASEANGEAGTHPFPSQPTLMDRFDEFWTLYPRKEKKDKAREAWEKATARCDPGVIIAGLSRQLDVHPLMGASERQYVPHPTSWLNAGRWTDEVTRPAPSGPTRKVIGAVEVNGVLMQGLVDAS